MLSYASTLRSNFLWKPVRRVMRHRHDNEMDLWRSWQVIYFESITKTSGSPKHLLQIEHIWWQKAYGILIVCVISLVFISDWSACFWAFGFLSVGSLGRTEKYVGPMYYRWKTSTHTKECKPNAQAYFLWKQICVIYVASILQISLPSVLASRVMRWSRVISIKLCHLAWCRTVSHWLRANITCTHWEKKKKRRLLCTSWHNTFGMKIKRHNLAPSSIMQGRFLFAAMRGCCCCVCNARCFSLSSLRHHNMIASCASKYMHTYIYTSSPSAATERMARGSDITLCCRRIVGSGAALQH